MENGNVQVKKGDENRKHVVIYRPDLMEGCYFALPDHATLEQAIGVAKVLYPDKVVEVI